MNIFFQGLPTCGKGTQTKLIQKDYPQMSIISMGDLLRNKIGSNPTMAKGDLFPSEIVNQILIEAIGDRRDNFIFDGVPRELEQLNCIIDRDLIIDLVIELDVSYEEILRRCSDRLIHTKSGRIYSRKLNPPKVPGRDDETGDLLDIRLEDMNKDAILNRIKHYKALQPIVIDNIFNPNCKYMLKHKEYYKTHKLPEYHIINSEGSVQETYSKIKNIISQYLNEN